MLKTAARCTHDPSTEVSIEIRALEYRCQFRATPKALSKYVESHWTAKMGVRNSGSWARISS